MIKKSKKKLIHFGINYDTKNKFKKTSRQSYVALLKQNWFPVYNYYGARHNY